MSDYKDIIRKPETLNWFKAAMGINITRDCLLDVVKQATQELYHTIRKEINRKHGILENVVCSHCNTPNVLPCDADNKCCHKKYGSCAFHNIHKPQNCRNRLCNEICKEIVNHHRFRYRSKPKSFQGPTWVNTDACKWCGNPWEIAKCYLSKDGYTDVNKVEEADFNGIVNLLYNCEFFQMYFNDDLTKKENVCIKARDVMHAVCHSPQMSMTSLDSDRAIDTLVALLQSLKHVDHQAASKAAVDRLTQLKNGTLAITTEIVATTFVHFKENLIFAFEMKEALEKEKDNFVKEMVDALNEKDVLKTVQSKGDDVLKTVQSKGDDVLKTVQMKEALEKEKDKLVKEMVDALNEYTSKSLETIQRKEDDVLETVQRKGDDVLKTVKMKGDGVLEKVQSKGDEELEKVQSKGDDVLGTVQSKADEVLEKVQSKGDDVLGTVQRKGDGVLEKVQSKGDEELEKVQSKGDDVLGTVQSKGDDVLKTVQRKGDGVLETVQSKGEEELEKVQSKGDEVLEKLQSKGDEKLEKVQSKGDDVLEKVQSKGDKVLEKVQSRGDDVLEKVQSRDDVLGAVQSMGDDILEMVQRKGNDVLETIRKKENELLNQNATRNSVLAVETGAWELKAHVIRGAEHIESTVMYGRDTIISAIEAGVEELNAHAIRGTGHIESAGEDKDSRCKNILKTHPMHFKLRAVWQQCGRKSEDLKSLCDDVCKSIKSIKCVRHVYAAFKESDDIGVTFVVTVGSGVKLVEIEACLDDLEIVYVIKCVEFKKDGNEDKHNQQNVAIQDKDITLLRNCIKNHADHLYSKHRYLSIIKGCVHQLNNSNSGNDDQYEVRLALYVHAKGYIPIEEEPFTKTIGGIQINVREGLFIPLMYADEVLEPISMGCQLSRHQSGTLGVFFEHARYGLCGITSAHVLLTDTELQQCITQRGKLVPSEIKEVFQPRSPDTIGKIMEVIYREGDYLNRGLEIGLIAIETRKPKQGKFPSPRSGENLELKYSSGRADELRQNNLNCVKFGAATGYTKGMIVNKSLPNVMRSTPWKLISGSAEITLYNQVEIQPMSGTFADFGDSGAPVFVIDGDGELVCVGIVSGGIDQSQNVMITPMTVILEEFGISKLKTFTPNLELMEQNIAEMKQSIGQLAKMTQNIEQLVLGLLPARNVAQ